MSESGGDEPVSSVRLAVDHDHLDLDNPLHYLVGLATEARRYDGAWNGDAEQAAQWVVAQWCQEVGWVPDLQDYEPGEQVDRGDNLDSCEWAFYPPADLAEGEMIESDHGTEDDRAEGGPDE